MFWWEFYMIECKKVCEIVFWFSVERLLDIFCIIIEWLVCLFERYDL